jgi:hypothetical protein
MIKLKHILTELESSLSIPQKFTAHYQATDGHTKEETFTNVEELKRWIDKWVGLDGEISDTFNYIVSNDGVGRIHVKGLNQGELRTLLGRAPLPKIQGKGYGKNLAQTSYLLNLPKKLHGLGKFEVMYGGEGMSCIYDFEGEPIKNNRQYGNPLTKGRLVFHIDEDKWSGDISLSVSLFYTGEGWDQVRVVDKHVHFKSDGDVESDLEKSQKLFEIPEVRHILQYLEQHTENINR